MTDEVEDQAALDESVTETEEVQAVEETQESTEATAASDTEVSSEEVDEKQIALNRLAFEKREEKRKAKALQEELDRLKSQIPTVQADKPKLEDFDYDEQAYTAAVIKYEVQQGLDLVKQQQLEDRKAEDQKAIQAKFNTRVVEVKKKVPNYENLVATLPDFQPETLNTILQMDDGPEVAVFLAKHADIADAIAESTPTAAALTLGRISLQLTNTKPKPKPSAAPAPIDPISQNGASAGEKTDPLIAGATFE